MFSTRLTYLFVAYCFFLNGHCFGQNKAVFIILDGIPADAFEKAPTPYLDSISRAGNFAKAYVGGELNTYNQSPTISAPGYNHILTGTWSNKHNVWDNKIERPNYNYWNVFRIVETIKPSLKTALFSTWEDNRTKLVGEGLSEAGNIKLDYTFDGFEKDTSRFPHLDETYISKIDEHVANEAARWITAKGPDLSWIYLEYTDDMGHKYGDSEQFYKAISKADEYVGKIWRAIREREKKSGEKWMIVVTTDHGRQPETGKSHGGRSERERTTWIATNIKDVNGRFTEGLAAVDICPTLLRYLKITPNENLLNELDGLPFIGKISFTDLKVKTNNNKLELTWKPLRKVGKAKIFVARTNNSKEGKEDKYELVGEAKISDGKFSLTNNQFKKVLVVTPENRMSRWITE
jgi:hypothetical protein